jgi:hypothetical protein
MPSFASLRSVAPSSLPEEREADDAAEERASQRPKRASAAAAAAAAAAAGPAPRSRAAAAAASDFFVDDGSDFVDGDGADGSAAPGEPSAESVAHALAVQLLETDQKLFEIMDQNMRDLRVFLMKRSQVMAAMLASQKFRDVRDLKRAAEAPSAEASREAKRQVVQQVQVAAADEARAKKNLLNSYRMAAEVLAKNAPGARQCVERVCIDVAHAIRHILVSAGANPHEPCMRKKLEALQRTMGDPEGEVRRRVQAAVYSPPKKSKKKDAEDDSQEYFTLASLSDFIRATQGGRGLIRAAAVDDIMRAIVATQRLEENRPDIPHFERTLSDEWGIPGIFRISNGIFIVNGETFAAAVLQVRSGDAT